MEEVSFPRGGRSHSNKNDALAKDDNQKERKRSRSKAKSADAATSAGERDFLFGAPPNTASSSSSKKRKTTDKAKAESSTTSLIANRSSLMPLGGGGVVVHQGPDGASTSKDNKKQQHQQRSKEPFIEPLSFSKLAKQTKLLAVVREVLDDVCVVSLPNFLTGYILRDTKKINQNNSNLKVRNAQSSMHITRVLTHSVSLPTTKNADFIIVASFRRRMLFL